MALVPVSNAEAKIYNLHSSSKRPSYTLYLWSKCPHCPPFRKVVEEALLSSPKTRVNLVMVDDDWDGVTAEVRGFPTLRKKTGSETQDFAQKATKENLMNFFR